MSTQTIHTGPESHRAVRAFVRIATFASLTVLIVLTIATSMTVLAVFADGNDDYFPYRRYRDLMMAATVFDGTVMMLGLWLLFRSRIWQPLTISLLFLFGARILAEAGSALQSGFMVLVLGMIMLMLLLSLNYELRSGHRTI